jgi:hypothetical protein
MADMYGKGSCGEKVPKTGSLKRNKPTRGRIKVTVRLMPGGLISVVVIGDKKKGSCCPACAAEGRKQRLYAVLA